MTGSILVAEFSYVADDAPDITPWHYMDSEVMPATHPLDEDSLTEQLFDWLAAGPCAPGHYRLAIYQDYADFAGRRLEAEAFLDWDGSDRLHEDRTESIRRGVDDAAAGNVRRLPEVTEPYGGTA